MLLRNVRTLKSGEGKEWAQKLLERESNSQGSECVRVFGAQGSFVASECKGIGVGQEPFEATRLKRCA